jgi:hypothetical protein
MYTDTSVPSPYSKMEQLYFPFQNVREYPTRYVSIACHNTNTTLISSYHNITLIKRVNHKKDIFRCQPQHTTAITWEYA